MKGFLHHIQYHPATLKRALRPSHLTSLLLLAALFTGCGHEVPSEARYTGRAALTCPDYDGVAIPSNIAPLNFDIEDEADDYLTHIHCGDDEIVVSGQFVDIPLDDWHTLLEAHRGDSLRMDIYEKKEGQWERTKAKSMLIAPDTIDPYLVYRLIEPSYVAFEDITINQRNLTNFDVRVVYDNMAMNRGDGKDEQCVNCHSFQDYNRTERMQMHFRLRNGGTLVMQGHDLKKVNLKSDSAVSSGVYPSWHPTERLIAYSMNNTGQNFHTIDRQKVEVLDYASDVVVYDVERNTTTYVAHEPEELETFPYWSPDGKWLYYCTAHFTFQTDKHDMEMAQRAKEIRYDIVRRSFDASTRQFGKADTVVSASSIGKSATFPRVSPDGRYLIYTLADYGNFHIWHRSADLWLKDLQSGATRPLSEVNSPEVESYHAWSRNGRWLVVSSRRGDGNYTRPYLAWMDPQGNAHKPFLLPQRHSHYYQSLYKSFNIPEFIVAPVVQSQKEMMRTLEGEAETAKMEE